MKKLILHIGPHKTGSTYLQRCFQKHKNALLKANIHYPNEFNPGFGHHELFTELQSQRLDAKFYESIDNINALDGTVILSTENLSYSNMARLEQLKSLFPKFEIQIVYFYRTPSKRLLSIWQELIKHGSTRGYSDFALEHYAKPFMSGTLNASIVLDKFSSVFGRNTIKIIDYEKCLKEEGMLKSFFICCGLPDVIQDSSESVNKMMDLKEIEIIRLLNIIGKQQGQLKAANIRKKYLALRTKNMHLINTLKGKMIDCLNIQVGNNIVDKLIDNEIKMSWKECLYSFNRNYEDNEILVPNPNWIMAKHVNRDINDLYDEIFSSTKSFK